MHFKKVCPLGHVISQCRCPAPDKPVTKGSCGECPTCKADQKANQGWPSQRLEG
jgi:hypothetical protein